MHFDPSIDIQDNLIFGEFGGVNPSITDSATFTFMTSEIMEELFDHEIEGCFLYARHWNPINKYLSDALAKMEHTEAGIVTSSGMSAISCTILQLCSMGDEIVCSRTIYGGTYALFKNFLPKFGLKVTFVNPLDLNEIEQSITDKTKAIYVESISNPLLEIADIPALSKLANKYNLKLVVDNTFSPLIISPKLLGAHIVVYSLTKFINGTGDCVAGCICADKEFISQLTDINSGASMLLGPVLDSYHAASILKNLHSLHIRIQKHSSNAKYFAEQFEKLGFKVYYPGLQSHTQHALMKELANDGFGYGGMVAVDIGDREDAKKLMQKMQEEKVGYFAVSLGYFKTLFSAPSHSTSSEIPEQEQAKMGLGAGLIRLSVGLDNDIKLSFSRVKKSLKDLNMIREVTT